MPVIIRDLDDDAAVIMVDSNLQRENILHSERAFALKMKMEAVKRQGERTDLTSCQIGTKFRADISVADGTGDSARTIQRFIRLTHLIRPLLDMVDERKIAFSPAVELSYLKPEEQTELMDNILFLNPHIFKCMNLTGFILFLRVDPRIDNLHTLRSILNSN